MNPEFIVQALLAAIVELLGHERAKEVIDAEAARLARKAADVVRTVGKSAADAAMKDKFG